MSKASVERKLQWLQNLFTNTRLSPLDIRLAGLLATKYINGVTKTAWPSVETLSRDLGAAPRSVQRAMAHLVELGLIERELERGRGHTNRYRLKGDVGVTFSAVKGDSFVHKRRLYGHPEPCDEPLRRSRYARTHERERASEETTSEYSRKPSARSAAGRARRVEEERKRTQDTASTRGAGRARVVEEKKDRKKSDRDTPARSAAGRARVVEEERKRTQDTAARFKDAARSLEEFVLGTKELEVAASVARWDTGRARTEFQQFKTLYVRRLREWEDAGKEPRKDWSRYWQNYCEHGLGYDQRDAKKQSANGSASYRGNGRSPQAALQGLMNSYQRQRSMYQEDNSDE